MPTVTLVRQKEIPGLKSDSLYPSVPTNFGLTVAVALYAMRGPEAVPQTLVHLFPYQGELLVPVPEAGLPIGVLVKSNREMWGLPVYVEGEPICEGGPRQPNESGIFPFVTGVSPVFLTHIMSDGGNGRPIITTYPDEGYAIAEAMNPDNPNYARKFRGCIDIWRRSQEQAKFDNLRGRHEPRSGDLGATLGMNELKSFSPSGDICAQTKSLPSIEDGARVALGLGDDEQVRVQIRDDLSFAADAVPLPRLRMVPQSFVFDLINRLNPRMNNPVWMSQYRPDWYSLPPLGYTPVAAKVPSLGARRAPPTQVFGTSATICDGSRSCPHCFAQLNTEKKRGG